MGKDAWRRIRQILDADMEAKMRKGILYIGIEEFLLDAAAMDK